MNIFISRVSLKTSYNAVLTLETVDKIFEKLSDAGLSKTLKKYFSMV